MGKPEDNILQHNIKCLVFSQKSKRHAKKQECVTQLRRKQQQQSINQSLETNSNGVQMLGLADKDIRATIINILKQWKKTMFHKLKKNMMTMIQQINNWTMKNKLKRDLNTNSEAEDMGTEWKFH